MRLGFVDLETTGVDPSRHHLWEIGLIVRDGDEPDREYCWHVRPDLMTADPMALRIGGYYDRSTAIRAKPGKSFVWAHPDYPDEDGAIGGWSSVDAVADEVAELLDGAALCAANVGFDAGFLAKFLRDNGQAASWDYHLVEVESYAAGALGVLPPWKLNTLADKLGVTQPDAADRHTALGDARYCRDIFDAATKRNGDPQ